MIIIDILAGWYFADLVSGTIHWWEDHYLDGDSKIGFLNRISADNDLHHEKPMEFTKNSVWDNMTTTTYVFFPLGLLMLAIDAPLFIVIAHFLGCFANVVHRWGHMPKSRLNTVIRFMQWTGLFISSDHHNAHHFKNKKVVEKWQSDQKWCPMTNHLNPILDRIGYFKALAFVFRCLGYKTTKERRNY